MADYESDSSGADDIQTNVLLGYASREPTGDDFSRLGGHPFWLDGKTTPSGALAKCRVCNELLSLLLQLNADLPEKFPGHERRLYILACRRKACRRKDGAVRGFRADRHTAVKATDGPVKPVRDEKPQELAQSPQPSQTNLGESLFGVQPTFSSQTNPFASTGGSGPALNPFAAASSLAAKPAQKPTAPAPSLSETFAQKVKISTDETTTTQHPDPVPFLEWPETSAFPEPYPQYYLDADKEYIDAEPPPAPSGVRIDPNGMEGESGSAADDKAAFESSMDKTFQRFADRLAQNPEQILRYEHAGQPLLYSKADAVGKLLGPTQENANAKVKSRTSATGSRLPRCTNCGAERVFELQLTPHAITELEVDDMSVDGMDWGTIILAVCGQNCTVRGKGSGDVGYVEEWTGVQWEEIANSGSGSSRRS